MLYVVRHRNADGLLKELTRANSAPRQLTFVSSEVAAAVTFHLVPVPASDESTILLADSSPPSRLEFTPLAGGSKRKGANRRKNRDRLHSAQ
jgi:hypothetical protein